jgi:hypothetical protein
VACELGGGLGDAAPCGAVGSGLECFRDRRVGRFPAATEVQRLLLRLGDELGEQAMSLAALVRRRFRVDRGRKQWMRKTDPVAADL